MISKTDFMLYLEAPLHLWAAKHGRIEVQPTLYEQHLMEQGREIETLARKFLKKNYLSGSNLEIESEVTFQDGIFQSRADVVARDPRTGEMDLYEIKSATSIRKEDQYDVTFQRLVCEATETVRDVFIVHVNKEYSHSGELGLGEMFLVVNMNEAIADLRQEVAESRQRAALIIHEPSPDALEPCLRPNNCKCPSLCHGQLPDYPIYNLPYLHRTRILDLRSRGINAIGEIPEDFPLSETQLKHKEAVDRGQPVIDLPAIQKELDKLEFPLSFLDYETYGPGLPFFPGYRPYQAIVYQYSLHVLEEEGGELKHFELLLTGRKDPGKRFIEGLIRDLPDSGSVVVWNQPFEGGKNAEMAERYPAYAEELLEINQRMYDLMLIFKKGYYIDPEFGGSASLKNVLPVLVPEFRGEYAGLEISNGEEAMLAWGEIWEETIAEEELPRVRKDLLAYCRLDTLAMVKIYEKLVEVARR